MYVAIYEFQVKADANAESVFLANWQTVTDAIIKYRGSLGSRLHKAEEGTYVAYAAWPSKELYEQEVSLPENIMAARTAMKQACSSIKVLKLMTVFDDRIM